MPRSGPGLFGQCHKNNSLWGELIEVKGLLWQIQGNTEYLRRKQAFLVNDGVLLNLTHGKKREPVQAPPPYSTFTLPSLLHSLAGVAHRSMCFNAFFLPHTWFFHRVNSQIIGISYCSSFRKRGNLYFSRSLSSHTNTKRWCECTHSEHSFATSASAIHADTPVCDIDYDPRLDPSSSCSVPTASKAITLMKATPSLCWEPIVRWCQ